jgi:putative CocE/NonD family hydrolase
MSEEPEPFDVELRLDLPIPMADGIELSGNLYLPKLTQPRPVPVILTFIPYHKDGRGGIGQLDAWHRVFAGYGFGVLHVDFRGTGASAGRPYGPFDGRERHDGHQVVEWIARQPWCTGAVGAWGGSYSGITAMAIAETRPPHLRAIVALNAPDDNYEAMFVHNGSRMLFSSDPTWGSTAAASNLMPPLRYDGSGDWLRRWRERLDAFSPWLLDWHGTPPDPDYWVRQRIDPAKIAVPCFIIGGWQDIYVDAASRIYAAVQGPKRLLIGPWKHVMPETSPREPVNALRWIARWWDRWLNDQPNGIDDEPPVTIFVQGTESWRSEWEWPPARSTPRRLYPRADHRLADGPAAECGGELVYDYDARVGVAALAYNASSASIPYPQDQSDDDKLSLCFATEPLSSDLEVTGEPGLRLSFSVDAPLTDVNLVAKLLAVRPDGQSFLITYNSVNAARARTAGANGEETVYVAELLLRPTSYLLRAGERLRLSISGGNFPELWPTPRRYRLRMMTAAPHQPELTLPVTPPQEPMLPRPAITAPPRLVVAASLDRGDQLWLHRSLTQKVVGIEGRRWQTLQIEPGSRLTMSQHFAFDVDADHPEAATSRSTTIWRLDRPSAPVEVQVKTIASQREIHVDADVTLADQPYVRQHWSKPTGHALD